MKKYLPILILISFVCSCRLSAQTLYPITEGLNPSVTDVAAVFKLREHLYLFVGYNPDTGREPYVTDGTQSGTHLLLDINSGSEWSWIDYFYKLNDSVCLFLATDGDNNHGGEMWRSNGTSSGTYMVADLTPGPASSSILLSNVFFDNKTFFTTHDSDWIGTLYVTDGSESGTIELLTGFAANEQTSGKVIAFANGIAYFSITVGPYSDLHLWRTDGTVVGTYELSDLNVGTGSQKFNASLGNNFLFSANDSLHGIELWKTDGTIVGTTIIKDLNPGISNSFLSFPHLLGNKIIFTAEPNDSTVAVWSTDGTSTGTFELGDSIFSPLNDCYIIGKSGSNIYFSATDYSSTSMFKTNGTIAGTFLVRTFPYCDLQSGNYADTLVEAYGLKFFVHNEWQYLSYLSSIWATDGTDSGTYEVYFNPYATSDPIRQVTAVCNQVFCEVDTAGPGQHKFLWTATPDTGYDLNLFSNQNEYPKICFVDDSALFFNSFSNSNHTELYRLQVCGVYTPVQIISVTNSLTLYPNPNDGLFTLELPDNLSNAEVRVIDMMGKSRYINKLSASQDRKLNLQLENIPSGIYSLQIISNEERWQQIFIKQ